MEILNLSVYLSQLSVLIPLTFFLSKRNNFKNPYLRILGILLLTAAIADLSSFVIIEYLHLSNAIVNNIFTVLEFLLISWIYWEVLKEANRQYIKICVILFLIVLVINTFIQGLFELQNVTLSLSSALLIFMAYRFFRFLRNLPTIITKRLTAGRDVHFKTLFFINVGVFLYFTIDFWLFTLSPLMLEIFNEEAPVNLWAFHNVMNVVKNVLFAVGLYWAGRKELE